MARELEEEPDLDALEAMQGLSHASLFGKLRRALSTIEPDLIATEGVPLRDPTGRSLSPSSLTLPPSKESL